MASDEKILQFKALKTYNNRVKQYVDENAGSGGSTTLADLGITVSATQINDLTNISDYTYKMVNDLYTPYKYNDKSLVKYVDNSVNFSSLNDTSTKSVNTYLSSSSYKIIGGVLFMAGTLFPAPIALCYKVEGSYYYAYFRLYHSSSGGSAFNATLRTLYTT